MTSNVIGSGSAVVVSTGLGLPLCRSFALAGGGWAGIEEVLCTKSPGVDVVATNLDWTQFWAVMVVDPTDELAMPPNVDSQQAVVEIFETNATNMMW